MGSPGKGGRRLPKHSFDPVRLCCVHDADAPIHNTKRSRCVKCNERKDDPEDFTDGLVCAECYEKGLKGT